MSSKLEDWIYSRMKNQDKVTDFDRKLISLVATALPQFIGVTIQFSIMFYIYNFLYNKYGIERVFILLMINLIISVGFVRKAISGLLGVLPQKS